MIYPLIWDSNMCLIISSQNSFTNPNETLLGLELLTLSQPHILVFVLPSKNEDNNCLFSYELILLKLIFSNDGLSYIFPLKCSLKWLNFSSFASYTLYSLLPSSSILNMSLTIICLSKRSVKQIEFASPYFSHLTLAHRWKLLQFNNDRGGEMVSSHLLLTSMSSTNKCKTSPFKSNWHNISFASIIFSFKLWLCLLFHSFQLLLDRFSILNDLRPQLRLWSFNKIEK